MNLHIRLLAASALLNLRDLFWLIQRPRASLVWIAAFMLVLLFLCMNVSVATAPINTAWYAKYAENNQNKDFRLRAQIAGCKVCHEILPNGRITGENGYGDAIKKFVKAAEVKALADNEEKLKAYISDGLKRAGLERSSNGKLFQDLLDAGVPPWEEP